MTPQGPDTPTAPGAYEALKALAEAATPGPWHEGDKGAPPSTYDFRRNVYCDDGSGGRVASCAESGVYITDDAKLANAAYIAAANPTVILALLTELSSLRADAERLRWIRDNAQSGLVQAGDKTVHRWTFDLPYWSGVSNDWLTEGLDAARSSTGGSSR